MNINKEAKGGFNGNLGKAWIRHWFDQPDFQTNSKVLLKVDCYNNDLDVVMQLYPEDVEKQLPTITALALEISLQEQQSSRFDGYSKLCADKPAVAL